MPPPTKSAGAFFCLRVFCYTEFNMEKIKNKPLSLIVLLAAILIAAVPVGSKLFTGGDAVMELTKIINPSNPSDYSLVNRIFLGCFAISSLLFGYFLHLARDNKKLLVPILGAIGFFITLGWVLLLTGSEPI